MTTQQINVRELPAKWREGRKLTGQYSAGINRGLKDAADELEAALRQSGEATSGLVNEVKRLREALSLIATQGPHYGPDGTYKTWRHWADIARSALESRSSYDAPPAAVVDDARMARALEWVRAETVGILGRREHLPAIEEAIAAYDARGGT